MGSRRSRRPAPPWATRWPSWSTSTRAGGWPGTLVPRWTRPPPAGSPPVSPSATCCGSRSPLAGTDLRGLAGASGGRARDPGRRRRDDADVRGDAGRTGRRRVRRLPAGRRPGRRDAAVADRRRAGAGAQPLVHAPYLDERHRRAREPPRRGRRRRRPLPRVPVRPARLDPRTSRRDARDADPARCRRSPARAAGTGPRASSSTRTPSRGTRHDAAPTP